MCDCWWSYLSITVYLDSAFDYKCDRCEMGESGEVVGWWEESQRRTTLGMV
jgi:hypothetical protein